MLALLYAYLIAPRGFRRILRWLAMGFFVVVLVMVLMLFWRVLQTLSEHHGWFLHPESHQPMSPDSIRFHLNRSHTATKDTL
jgi:hypothetical protein